MTKPIYKYPDFVTKVSLKQGKGKRYWLRLEIDPTQEEDILVILKNPSRADMLISDKTVFNVSNYIYRNRDSYPELKHVGGITILNLIPHYLTDSSGLHHYKENIIDNENTRGLNAFCTKTKKVIIAWGNHPKGLYSEYEQLKSETIRILENNHNEVFYVKGLTKSGNPIHGQVWAYKHPLLRLNIRK